MNFFTAVNAQEEFNISSLKRNWNSQSKLGICSDFDIVLYVGSSHINLSQRLFSLNYTGLGMNDLKKAYNWLQSRSHSGGLLPKVIFCDLNIAQNSLKEFMVALKNNKALNSIPVIFYANDDCEQKRILTLKLGGDDFYSKESDVNDINERIEFLSCFKKLRNKSSIKRNTIKTKKAKKIESIIRRAFDIILSGLALIFLSPIFIIVAIIVRLESKGSILYVSKRVGSNLKTFNFYKFRTMKEGADKELQKLLETNNQYNTKTRINDGKETIMFCKIQNDPRITSVGSFLRKTSLDEIPQLFNVLKGDMSIVGNRPLPLYEASTLTKDQFVDRFLAPAGITGLWQVTKRGKKDMSTSERVELDIRYARKNSFFGDLQIIFKTIPALIQKENV